MSDLSQSLALADVSVSVFGSVDGDFTLRNNIELPDDDSTVIDKVESWASKTPDAPFLCQRKGEGWDKVSYLQFYDKVKAVASRLACTSLSADRPLLILAPNSIDHAIVSCAAMYIGVPVASISPAYGLMAKTFDRLQQIIEILQPGAAYVSDASLFESSVSSMAEAYPFPILTTSGEHPVVRNLEEGDQIEPEGLQALRDKIGPGTLAKIMFTSGSTGVPKGVLVSQQMMISNQVALHAIWPFLSEHTPRLVDWLPWSHTFGGNVCFNVVLYHGGVLFIDDGKPSPALIERTVENLKLGKPNILFNVPAGIEALLPHFENDKEFCQSFFADLNVLFVAAAALPQKARDRIVDAAKAAGVAPPRLLAGWGSTETAPFATGLYFDTARADNIGLPMPGTEIKFVRNQSQLELCVKGPNVTSGYWNNQDASEAAFDADGFYKMGDAGILLDAEDPAKGIAFDGRISENFKLLSGTWTNVGTIRTAVIDSLRPLCLDAVVTGHNQADLGLLLIPNYAVLAREFGLRDEQQNARGISNNDAVVEAICSRIESYNKVHCSNSAAIGRFAILPEMPRIDLNEITDKGYLNQRQLLESWKELVSAMHAESSEKVLFFRK